MAFQVIAWVLEALSQHLGRRGFLRLGGKSGGLAKKKKEKSVQFHADEERII